MNDNYKWKGVTFNSKGIIIEKTPIVPKANHSFTKYTIPGKNGYLSIDNKTYDPISFSLECHLNTAKANMNEIRAWLDGYGTLQVDSERIYTGYISNSISFEKIVNFRKFIVQFMLQPIAQSSTPTIVTSTETTTFQSESYTNSNPIITLTGSGNITIGLNGTSFTIYDADGTYILDCGAKIITKNGTNQSMNMSGDFPYVVSGTNSLTVTGTVTDLSLSYYKTFL